MSHPRVSWLAALCLALSVGGCAQFPPYNGIETNADTDALPVVRQATPPLEMIIVTATPLPNDLWTLIASEVSWESPDPDRTASAREIFLAQSQLVPVLSDRAEPFLQYVVAQVQARKLPIELALVPVVESMLDPWAHSSARASGLWQVTPDTGEHYGLQRSWWYDDRLDFVKATDFALNYLVELHATFNDWPLALAAYNAGPNRLKRLIAKSKKAGQPTDYWQLTLPRETRDYVPKIIALGQLIQHPAEFGLAFPNTPIIANLTAVSTGGQIALSRVARLAGIETNELRRLNTAHLRWATAPDGPDFLWMTAAAAAKLGGKLATLTADQRVQWQHYEIQSGDSLISIARQFDTQVQLIREVNGLSGSLIRAGKTLMIPQGGDWRDSLHVASQNNTPSRPSRYRVQTGDSLWSIAQHFDLTLGSLVRWNSLNTSAYLQPGQTLRLQP